MVYVCSDHHLGDKGMVERLGFSDPDEHANHIVTEHNNIVHSNDIVYFLGDVGTKTFIEKYLPKMRGTKVIILGNHDRYSKKFYNEHFDYVYNKPFWFAKRILLSHYPEKITPGKLNIHGHTHSIDVDLEGYYNVCVERTNYKPVKMKVFYTELGKIKKPNSKFLEEWYMNYQRPVDKRDDLVLKENGLIDVNKSKELRKKGK